MNNKRLRSRSWFDNPDNPGMTALYLERCMNYGLTLEELRDSGKPIIGIAQTGSDLSPCNRHHIELAVRVKEGIRDAGGIPRQWLGKVRRAMTTLVPQFSTWRMVQEYTRKYYQAK